MAAEGDYEALGQTFGQKATPRAEAFEAAYPRTPRRRVLGSGSFGVVYAVCQGGDASASCVAKEIPVAKLSTKKQQEVLAESNLLRKMSHPHIVACLDAVLTGSNLYIVMEYASGGDLCMHIVRRKDARELFPERTVMTTFAQIAAGLQYVHSRKVMHRDVKPANVFVFGSGDLSECRVKIGDFGLSKLFEATTFEAYSQVGSPSYFSPEVCKGKAYGRKSDIWSLGVVLYEMAALEVPFKARAVPAVAVMICRSEPAPLPQGFGAELRALVSRMLQKEPGARPSAEELAADPHVRGFAHLVPEEAAEGRAQGAEPPPPALPEEAPASLPPDCADSVKASFQEFDAAAQGKVSKEVLAQFLSMVAPKASQEDILRILEAAAGGHGEDVDFPAFVEWLSDPLAP